MNIFSKLSIAFICLLSITACSKDDEQNTANGSRIKNFANKDQVTTALGSFVDGYTEGGLNETLFYMGENYPTGIADMYYNIPFKREAAGYEYSRQIIGRTTAQYQSYEFLTTETAHEGYVEISDDRLSNAAYSNVRIAKAPDNNELWQTFIAHIDLKEEYSNSQVLLLHTIRSGFNGDPDNALPVIDDKTAITHLLEQLESL